MDKNTLSNYGWIVIAVLVLSVMIALATPFGEYIKAGVESTTAGLFETSEKALNVVGMSAKTDINVRDKYEHQAGYIDYKGVIQSNAESKYIRVPVNAGETWYVWFKDPWNLGTCMLRYEDSSNQLVSYLNMSKQPMYKVNPDSNTLGAVVEIPSGVSYMCVTLKFVDSWDYSETAFIAKGTHSLKLVTFGDSITQHNQTANINWVSHTTETFNALECNLGISGYGYAARDGSFISQLSKLPSDAELVVLYGSFNDLISTNTVGSASDVYTEGENNTLAACMNYTYDYIKNHCTNAEIVVIAPAPWTSMKPTGTDESSIYAQEYVAVMEEICETKGLHFLDLFHTSGMTPWDYDYRLQYFYNNDGCHPNDEGHKILASKIIPFLQNVID